jgi:hypothetical protein
LAELALAGAALGHLPGTRIGPLALGLVDGLAGAVDFGLGLDEIALSMRARVPLAALICAAASAFFTLVRAALAVTTYQVAMPARTAAPVARTNRRARHSSVQE